MVLVQTFAYVLVLQAIASVATLGYGAMLMGPPTIGFVAEATSLRASFLMVGCVALMIAALAPVLGRATRRATA